MNKPEERFVCIPLDGPQYAGIQTFRTEHDPIGKVSLPHITLMFPFLSEVPSEEIWDLLLPALEERSSFEIQTGKPKLVGKEHIWLLLLDKEERISKLHRELYECFDPKNLNTDIPFTPHITLGKISSGQTSALEKARKISLPERVSVSEVVFEEIHGDASSTVLFQHQLS